MSETEKLLLLSRLNKMTKEELKALCLKLALKLAKIKQKKACN